MQSGDDDTVRDALADHDAFEAIGDAFAVATSPFTTHIEIRDADAEHRVDIEVVVPTLEEAVTGEAVAPVVQEGWFETFALRLEDVGAATRSDPITPRVRLESSVGHVIVETSLVAPNPETAIADAKAIVDFVEGTYVEGIIPGYEYGDPVTELVDRARAVGTDGEPTG